MPTARGSRNVENNHPVDPSENVKALSEAANRRQDDLRVASEKLSESETRRLDSEIGHLKEMGVLRADHATEIRQMETERLDSIRQVDVLARNTAADRAADAIQALAATTATNAENLRTALANTAQTIAKQTADTAATTAKQTSDMFEAVTKRVATLEASGYRGEGKEKYADPQMAELMTEMKLLRGTRSEGIDKTWGVVAVIITLIIAGAGVYAASRVAPQIVYVPSPTLAPSHP